MTLMRPLAFGEALPAGNRVTLFLNDKPDHFFTVIKFWMDETSGVTFAFQTGVPSYQVEDGGSTELAEVLPRCRLCGGGRKADFIY